MSDIEDIADWLDSPRWCDGPTQARFKEAAEEIRRLRRVSTYDETRKSIAKVREETLAKAVAERDALASQVERQKAALVQIGVVAMDNAAAPRADLALKFIREIVGSVPSENTSK